MNKGSLVKPRAIDIEATIFLHLVLLLMVYQARHALQLHGHVLLVSCHVVDCIYLAIPIYLK